MKARLATLLSLSGVLTVGSVAALVNAQVLQPSAQAAPDRLANVQLDVAGPVISTALSAPPAASQATYAVAAAGTVRIDTAGGVLTLLGVSPADGWSVVSATSPEATTVEVSLQSGTTVVQFRATVLFGVVSTTVTTVDQSPTTVQPPRSTHHAVTTTTEAEHHHGNGWGNGGSNGSGGSGSGSGDGQLPEDDD